MERSRTQGAIYHAQNHFLCPVSVPGRLACIKSLLITPTNIPLCSFSESEREGFEKKKKEKLLGGQRGGDRDKVQRAAEVSCTA